MVRRSLPQSLYPQRIGGHGDIQGKGEACKPPLFPECPRARLFAVGKEIEVGSGEPQPLALRRNEGEVDRPAGFDDAAHGGGDIADQQRLAICSDHAFENTGALGDGGCGFAVGARHIDEEGEGKALSRFGFGEAESGKSHDGTVDGIAGERTGGPGGNGDRSVDRCLIISLRREL